MESRRLRGTRDICPPESRLWQDIAAAFFRVINTYSFSFILTPVIEKKALFARGIGEGTDIVMKEMYEFKDKKGREIALRPEGTASAVRAYIENSLPERSDLAYIGQMYRYEKPQKGRNREFYQAGVESFGDGSPFKDAEIIKMADDIMKAAGAADYKIHINMLNCPGCGPAYTENLRNYFNSKKEELCPDCVKKTERAPVRIFDCKKQGCRETAGKAPKIKGSLCGKCKEHFNKLKMLLDKLSVNYVEDENLVRGLDYYTGPVFEFITDKLGPQQNTILAGGRYDSLVKELGGKDMPATGFALGIERMAEVIKSAGNGPKDAGPKVFVVYDRGFAESAFKTLFLLREKNISCGMSFREKSIKAQMREAASAGASFAVITGEKEEAGGVISVKDMQSGEQTEMKPEELIEKAGGYE